jgi:N-acetylneuraminic acid mutarotase
MNTLLITCILVADPATIQKQEQIGDTRKEVPVIATKELTPLTEPTSSFGGAVDAGWLYVYSGHVGGEHEHSSENLSPRFQRLNLADAAASWQELPGGTPLQGVPLVADKGKLYRVGGLSAKNKPGEPEDLYSVASAQVFDVASGKWSDLPELPVARSSHDAAIVGDKLYVVGGWTLAGENKSWIDSALVLDLNQPTTGWREIAKPPFQRRALAVAGHQGKIYAIGGMDSQNKTSQQVDIYDIAKDQWSAGPVLPTESRMKAFGASAWGTADAASGGSLFACGTDGLLFKLTGDGSAWVSAGKLDQGRFFHRLLPGPDQSLLIVGGASMKSGKHLASVALVTLP